MGIPIVYYGININQADIKDDNFLKCRCINYICKNLIKINGELKNTWFEYPISQWDFVSDEIMLKQLTYFENIGWDIIYSFIKDNLASITVVSKKIPDKYGYGVIITKTLQRASNPKASDQIVNSNSTTLSLWKTAIEEYCSFMQLTPTSPIAWFVNDDDLQPVQIN